MLVQFVRFPWHCRRVKKASSLASGTPTGLVAGISNNGAAGQTLVLTWMRI